MNNTNNQLKRNKMREANKLEIYEVQEAQPLLQFIKITYSTSLFFWCWAMWNTTHMESGLDLGIVSFFTTLMSSTYLWFKIFRHDNIEKKVPVPLSRCNTIGVVFSHAFVALNYALGLFFALTIDETMLYNFGTYCWVFMMAWGYSTYRAWELLKDWNEKQEVLQERERVLSQLYERDHLLPDDSQHSEDYYHYLNLDSHFDDIYANGNVETCIDMSSRTYY